MMYKENMTSNMQTQHLRHSLESRMVDPSSIREIETLKNELNLTSKIKASLEQQIQVYKKQSNTQEVDTKQKVQDLLQELHQVKEELREEIAANDTITHKLDKNDKTIAELKKAKVSLTSDVEEATKEKAELEKQLKGLQKPSLEQMRREVLSAKSKFREKDSHITDLKDRIITIEKENEKFKESVSSLKKANKEMKQDLDLQNKQSFKLVQSERDELEEKLRQEIRQRQQDAEKWFSEKTMMDGALQNLRSHTNELAQATQININGNQETETFKSKANKYKKKNQVKTLKITELEQKIHNLDNEKEEYRIKYTRIESKTDELQAANLQLNNKLEGTQSKLRD